MTRSVCMPWEPSPGLTASRIMRLTLQLRPLPLNLTTTMFTPADIRHLHNLCERTPSLPKPPKTLNLVTGDGVILESAARDQIRRILYEGDYGQ